MGCTAIRASLSSESQVTAKKPAALAGSQGRTLPRQQGDTHCQPPLALKEAPLTPVSSVASRIQSSLNWVCSPPSKKKDFFLIKNVNNISLSAGNHNRNVVDFTIIGSDFAQGGGWAECTLKNPHVQLLPSSPQGLGVAAVSFGLTCDSPRLTDRFTGSPEERKGSPFPLPSISLAHRISIPSPCCQRAADLVICRFKL